MTPIPNFTGAGVLAERLGPVARRFVAEDGVAAVLADLDHVEVVTGFGPTNAPTAGTLSVMLGIIELQRTLGMPMTTVVSELGAWNCRNVVWDDLLRIRDQMLGFLAALGYDTTSSTLRSHLDHGNLTRAGRIARYLTLADFHRHREQFQDLYEQHGLLGGEVGMLVDGLYTVADILEPAQRGARGILMVSGREEAYYTRLARELVTRQRQAGDLGLGWDTTVAGLYLRGVRGLAGYPKMSKSIPTSAIDLGMDSETLTARVTSEVPADQPALLDAITLASGWENDQIKHAHEAYDIRQHRPAPWAAVKREYLDTFLRFARTWAESGR
jgi:tryptophanyl-tRNA synthetase